MMIFTQRKVGLSRLHRTHLPEQRLSSLIRAAKQGYGLAGGRAIQRSTFCGLGSASQRPAIESRFVAGQVWGDTIVRGQLDCLRCPTLCKGTRTEEARSGQTRGPLIEASGLLDSSSRIDKHV